MGMSLTVFLEKICSNNYINKLRAICPFKADFNWWNKLVFVRRMMDPANEKGMLPIENYTKKIVTVIMLLW